MDEPQDLSFVKLEGCGNDYLFIDRAALPPGRAQDFETEVAQLAPLWCHRRYGVGADGIVLHTAGSEPGEQRMLMWNSDGSRGSLCVNAARALVKLLGESEGAGRTEFRIESGAGHHLVQAHWEANRLVWSEVELGEPRLAAASVPIDLDRLEERHGDVGGVISVKLPALEQVWEGLVLSVGNPHLILPLSASPEDLPVAQLGSALQAHPAFVDGVNVGFSWLDEAGVVHSRTFERGSGETLACGSSAGAIAVAFASLGAVPAGRDVEVKMRGGTLTARWSPGGPVVVAGPAREVFRGVVGWPDPR